MKHIGVYLASDQHGGGTYQYNLSIINALKYLDTDEYKLTAFIHNKSWNKHLSDKFTIVFKEKTFVLRVLKKIYRISQISRRFPLFFNPIINEINNSDCDIIIFPSQDEESYQSSKKSLSTIHDLMHRYESHFEEYQNGEYDLREKHFSLISKNTNGVLVDSIVGKQHVIESYNINEEKVFVLPFVPPFYLLESNPLDVKLKYSLPSKYFFYPAQFWEHKNHNNLLLALKSLKDRSIECNLVLVGAKKNNYNSVIKKIEELGLSDNVYILGYVSNDDMASLYMSALATTFVSLIGPTNIPPLEAMVLGSPLICSNVYAMPEQVGDAALLVDPKNPIDIAKKMEMIIYDNELVKNLIQKGKEKMKKYGQKEFSTLLESHIKCL